MPRAGGRTGWRISRASAVLVRALNPQMTRDCHGNVGGVCGNIPQKPILAVRIHASNSAARIMVHDNGQTFGPLGNPSPCKRRRQTIAAVTGAFQIGGQRGTVGKRGARQGKPVLRPRRSSQGPKDKGSNRPRNSRMPHLQYSPVAISPPLVTVRVS
jgi:hypothetical protein